jgi:redox-sensitive bicupin YhaK (pirin superfamily)
VEPTDPVELVIEARDRDLGDVVVGRVLPSPRRRMVGPFIFFDHIGPATFAMNVRPHPHIHLATVTYLFEGVILHRDSLGSTQAIEPGAINWMTAGRGIVHSERTPEALQQRPPQAHGVQLWCALPAEHEDAEPAFVHYPASSIPQLERDGATIRVLAGEAYGARSPVATLSRLFYVDVLARAASSIDVPDYEERAIYVVEGGVTIGGQRFAPRHMAVLAPGAATIALDAGSRVLMLGGDPVGARHIEWNFVSSSRERIEQAKAAWRAGDFPKVPGDEEEFIPLPPDPS